MICPKCQFDHRQTGPECPKCGIVFEKYLAAQKASSATAPETVDDDLEINSQPVLTATQLFFHTAPEINPVFFAGRVLLLIVMTVWGAKFIWTPLGSNASASSFLHLANLPFHEAGHVVFRPFGQFMASLGGTLGQLLMPLICFGVLLLKTRDTFGASVTSWWFGENFIDIAPYINDARSLSLPLLGGNVGHASPYGFHDWEFILTESGLLRHDHTLAKLSFFLGSAIVLVSIIWAAILMTRQYKNLKKY